MSSSPSESIDSRTAMRESDIRKRIHRLLDEVGVPWEETVHEPARTAEEAAAARGCPIEIGAKSIVLKTDDEFRLFVLSGAATIASRFLRRHLGVRRTRFATPGELAELTGLEPGAVPPFGEPILPLEIYADASLLLNDRLAFTPGVRTASIILHTGDWVTVARPRIFPFAASPSAANPS